MIRKNTHSQSKRDISPGRIRNTSIPNEYTSPQKPTPHHQPLLLPSNEVSKLDNLEQSFTRMSATLNSLFDKSIGDKFKSDQSAMITQCLNGFQTRANEIESKLDKPILILKGIENQILMQDKRRNRNQGNRISAEHQSRFRDLEDKLRKLQNMMR